MPERVLELSTRTYSGSKTISTTVFPPAIATTTLFAGPVSAAGASPKKLATLPVAQRRSSNPKTATYGCDCFDHEEPVKVVLRQDRKMHVYDVKKHATREMDYRHASYSPETVRLLAAHLPGLLKPDDVWNNNRHFNSAHYPVIAIQTGYELIGLLNRTLACFSTFSALVSDRFKTRSQQKFEDYQQLYNILQTQLANPTSSSSLQ